MSLVKRLGCVSLCISAGMFVTSITSSIYYTYQLHKIPREILRSYEIEHQFYNLEKELNSNIDIKVPLRLMLDSQRNKLGYELKEQKDYAKSIEEEKDKLREEYQALMKREDVQEGRSYYQKINKKGDILILLELLSAITFFISLGIFKREHEKK
ncbi:hypothetical protein HYX16_05690 [Candidatus Woesearchaeota archaeon]|nr:hypothetical protein [Candidatus Woesearchaeota archaeon]